MQLVLHDCSYGNLNRNGQLLNDVENIWNCLSEKAKPGYFLSWGWVRTWLKTIQTDINLHLAVLYENEKPVCAFFLSRRKMTRHKAFRRRALFINTTGHKKIDKIYIEYNMILSNRMARRHIHYILDNLPFPWDEIYFPAMASDAILDIMGNAPGWQFLIDSVSPVYCVDLEPFYGQPENFLTALSSNTRNRVRRSYREYTKNGDISLEVAHDLDSAFRIFDELIALHNVHWESKGMEGAFSPFLLRFHRTLIEERFDCGEIQLIRISAGRETIGCLYNFVHNKEVLFYQGGINYTDPKLKPGLLVHTEAIKYNIKIKNSVYDFLCGDSQYKKSLSTDQRTMVWARLQKPLLKFSIEEFLKKKYLSLIGASKQGSQHG